MTERAVVIGRDGRAKAFRPLPAEIRAEAVDRGLAAYERGDFFEAHEELEPAWMGTDDPAERSLLQGLIKMAAAYVHGVRGNPVGIRRNLEGARRLLQEATLPPRSTPGTDPVRDRLVGVDPSDLIVAIDLRLEDLIDPSGRADPRPAPASKESAVTMPHLISTIDVTETDRRLRDDPSGPILLDVREASEFRAVRAPGAVLVPTSSFMARLDGLPAGRPLLVICHTGQRSAAVTGFLARAGRTDVFNVAGGMDAWERAGLPVRRGPLEPGEGDLPGA